jgi:nucleotide-binding universal stress UspA family protein
MKADHVLVPVDFSEPSRSAIRAARDIVADHGGRITLLHIGHVPYPQIDPTVYNVAGGVLLDISHRVAAAQMARLEEWAQAELPEVMEPTLLVREGPPWAEILAQIEADKPDLVVMGTHGRTGFSHAFLGSVTERVLQRSPVPVLVVK